MTEYRDRLRRLSPDGTTATVEWGPDGIIAASEGAAALYGISQDQLVGCRFWELLSPVQYLEMIEPQLFDGFQGCYLLDRPGDSLVHVEWTYHLRTADTGLFDLTFWEIEDASSSPSELPRLQLLGAV